MNWMPWRRRAEPPAPPLPLAAWTWLLGALALVLAPNVVRLPWWLSGLWLVVAGGRWERARRHQPAVGRWTLVGLTVAVSALLLWHYGTLLGRDAGIALLTAMCAMKVLEARAERDGWVLLVLGYLLLMADLLYDQDLPMVAHLLASLLVLLAAQLVLQRGVRGLRVLVAVRTAGQLMVFALPLMLILFVLFPRIPGPLWRLPKDAGTAISGLADSMAPGAIERLVKSAAVAFRVQFAGPVPKPAQRYWRGPVLWHYADGTWRGGHQRTSRQIPYRPEGDGIRQTITLEPHGRHWLFALDLPGSLPPQAEFTATYELRRQRSVDHLLRYTVTSYLHHESRPLRAYQRQRDLQLPARGNPRARALAARWRSEQHDPAAVVQAALQFYHDQPFVYTLQPPLLTGGNRIDQFLFRTRKGFCEHYAGSFVFLMRAAGIPARVVLGYQGGERNGNYLIVRQSDAHAWAEVWLPNAGGWRRVDPTAAVAPERVERGLYAAVDDPQALPFMARRGGDMEWLRRLGLMWDSVNNGWNQWVLAYGPQRQREFLSGLGLGKVDWRGMTVAMTVLLTLVPLLALLIGGWRRHRARDPLARLYGRLCRRLARRGVPRRPYEGPLDYSERAAAALLAQAPTLRRLGQLYARLRYREPVPADLDRFRELLRQI